ncbi:hypothetical protein [Phreatobacter sp.]|uniref:hypothetical protein n=1 Tax=Phreatobacter sp. TaxID=1966341 RepID=UPI0022C0E541|nr:hypothetical protein [Phreatobacter sp.]MCZ8314928.1 hypothetical protein [Phreatobacter sp.]
MSDRDAPWAVRHADTIFKIVLVVLAALWLVLPARQEPAKPRAEAALADPARLS